MRVTFSVFRKEVPSIPSAHLVKQHPRIFFQDRDLGCYSDWEATIEGLPELLELLVQSECDCIAYENDELRLYDSNN